VAALSNLKQGLANVQTSIHTPGGDPILRMGRDGVWIYGADNVEVQAGSRWAVNPMSLQHGFICWKKIPEGSKEQPELLGEETRSMFQPLPNKDTLPNYGHPWTEEIIVDMKCMNGEDEGEQVIYKPSSTGGLRAMKELIAEMMTQIDKDPAHPVPVLELLTDSYPHKQYGKTYIPILKIVDWVSMDGVGALAPAVEQAGAPEPETAAEAPKPTRRRTAAGEASTAPETATAGEPEPEPATAATPPAGGGERRRRRAV
jgi:hypothetical protein